MPQIGSTQTYALCKTLQYTNKFRPKIEVEDITVPALDFRCFVTHQPTSKDHGTPECHSLHN
jgi:hypothetical protein